MTPDRPQLVVDEEERILLDIDASLYGFSAVEVGDDGKWHRVDPARLSPAEPDPPTSTGA